MQGFVHERHQAVVCFDRETLAAPNALEDGVVFHCSQANRRFAHLRQTRAALGGGNQFGSKFVFHTPQTTDFYALYKRFFTHLRILSKL